MPFKALSLAHAPDADWQKHWSTIDTGMYRLFTVVVKDQAEALAACRDFIEREAIESVLLCPGFAHRDVAQIADAVGPGVGVCVARCDGPSSGAARAAMERAGYFSSPEEVP